MDNLKEFCKKNGYKCSIRRQGKRYYATISKIDTTEDMRNWMWDYKGVIFHFFPNSHMTSGSVSGATFMIGDVFELLKEKTNG